MDRKMWNKFAKYWDDIHLVLAISVVLDPRYKLHVIEYYAAKFGSSNIDIVGETIKQLVCDLVLEYQQKSEKNSTIGFEIGSSSTSPISSATDLDFDLSGGIILDPHCSRLHYATVEAMMCTRSWVKVDMKRDLEMKMEELEGVFTALTMEDATVEDFGGGTDDNLLDKGKAKAYNFDDID
ncbi:Zinc finger BED domain-containing protein RICESLEEPER 3 [Linum grandiflorum]